MILLGGILFALAVLASGLYSGLETGVYAYDAVGQKDKKQNIKSFLRHRERLVITCLIGTNCAVYMATLGFGQTLNQLGFSDSFQYFLEVIFLSPLLFILGEVLPKVLFQSRANDLLPHLIWFLKASLIIFLPLVIILQTFTKIFTFLTKKHRQAGQTLNRDHLHWVLQDQDKILTREQSQMVGNALKLQSRRVTSLMEPCKKVARISIDSDLEEIKQLFLQTDFSFLVVYERKPENVQGIVYLNKILLSDKKATIEDHLIEIPEISYKSSLTDALEVLRKHSKPIGKVVGAKNHVLGLVFTRRLIQEIVGELHIW